MANQPWCRGVFDRLYRRGLEKDTVRFWFSGTRKRGAPRDGSKAIPRLLDPTSSASESSP
jgi:hypothetical protein